MQTTLNELKKYSPCDIADALVQLGHLSSFVPHLEPIVWNENQKFMGPAHTVEFILTTAGSSAPSLPSSVHHIDSAVKDSVIVMKSPAQAINAVFGGLMAARANYLGVQGVVVEGRIRDITELQKIGVPVFASGTSALGARPYVRVSKLNEPITLAENTPWPVVVCPGDIMVGDREGVVRIPVDAIDQVLQICQVNTQVDAKCLVDIEKGHSITETFAKFRGK